MHISPIFEEREKSCYKKWIYPSFQGYSRYFTDIAHAYFDYVIPRRLLVFVFTNGDQNFWYKLYQIENLGFKLFSDGDLEILLDNADDANINKLIKNVVTHAVFEVTGDINAALEASVRLSPS